MEIRCKFYVVRSLVLSFAFALPLIGIIDGHAQTGPAGVGNTNSNKIWLDASYINGLANGARVSSWTDRSGNVWNANQATAAKRPTYLTNQLNGLPVVRFNRTNGPQYLDISNTGLGPVMSNNYTLYAVVKANSGAVDNAGDQWQSVFGNIDWYSGILIQGFPNAADLWFTTWVSSTNPPSTSITVTEPVQQGQWSIATSMPKETVSGTELSAYKNGVFAGSSSSPLQMRNFQNLVRIGGCLTSGIHQYLLNGDIAEIIFFSFYLNDAQRIIVDNYLSAKYNQVVNNDFYLGNDASYTRDVQGIGTTDGTTNKHSLAGNGRGLQLAEINNTLNGSNEFLLAGHAMTTNSIVTTDLPLGGQNRWQRVWYLEKTGNVDANLSFDFSQATLTVPVNLGSDVSNYKLLYRSSPSGNFTVVKSGNDVLTPVLENSDQLRFSVPDAQLSNGYYTLGYMPGLVWTGAVNEAWNQAGNWNLNRVPLPEDHVIINSCTTCPVLNQSVFIAGLKMTSGGKLNVENYTVSIAEASHVTSAEIISNSGMLKARDFDEIKSSTFTGSVTLEKTGGGNNRCFGGNTFSPELKISNLSNHDFQLATQADNVIH